MTLTDQSRSSIDQFDNIVTVLVGEERKRFIPHHDAVCARSKFLKAACSKQWRESRERVVRLPEVGALTFKAYSSWVYSGELPKTTCTDSSSHSDQLAEKVRLVELHLLGDSLDDIELRNETVAMLFNAMRI